MAKPSWLARESMTLAYDDVFWMLTLAFVAFLPFILLLRSGKQKKGAPPKASGEPSPGRSSTDSFAP